VVARRTRLIAGVSALSLALTGCAGASSAHVATPVPTVRILLAGDAMLGRSVAPIIEGDRDGVLEGVRRVIRAADLAVVNIESPLTLRPHAVANPYALEADPGSANILAAAGFDIAAVANNHAGDAGADSVIDTTEAITDSGMVPVGGGHDAASAWEPAIAVVEGVTVAFLAIDGSGQGLAATSSEPGVSSWDAERVEVAVRDARARADVVIVGLHGGIEYHAGADPLLGPMAEQLAGWGADVVWGHGPHVVQPITVIDPDGDGRPTVVATSLGNLLFDQQGPDTSIGGLLEVLVDGNGVVAHRIGATRNVDLRIRFEGWGIPDGELGFLDGSWWSLHRSADLVDTGIDPFDFSEGDVVAAAQGDLDGDGTRETLVSYRHEVRVKAHDPFGAPPTDASGRSAHLGVLDTLGDPIWLSRRPPHPVGAVAACDGTAAFAYTALDDDDVIATAAGAWSGFGFIMAPELAGAASIGCADVDGDGSLDAVILDRAG
jgi:poly-gamma-glutamate capsule biosynthesis protein CapA/YwtB (metallophosphatase superfamily)